MFFQFVQEAITFTRFRDPYLVMCWNYQGVANSPFADGCNLPQWFLKLASPSK